MKSPSELNKRVLVIVGCSKKKLDHPAPVIELNQGQLFQAVRRLASHHQFDLKILSGKHGLLGPEEIIEPYNQKIKTKADIKRIQETMILRIDQLWRDYDLIMTIMGKKYRAVLEPFFDNKFSVVFDKRGIGGYKSLVSHYSRLPTAQLLREIKKFQKLECAEYLWSCWDFNPFKKHVEPNHPHTCRLCTHNKEGKCNFSTLYPQYYKKYQEDREFILSLSEKDSKAEKILVSSKLN